MSALFEEEMQKELRTLARTAILNSNNVDKKLLRVSKEIGARLQRASQNELAKFCLKNQAEVIDDALNSDFSHDINKKIFKMPNERRLAFPERLLALWMNILPKVIEVSAQPDAGKEKEDIHAYVEQLVDSAIGRYGDSLMERLKVGRFNQTTISAPNAASKTSNIAQASSSVTQKTFNTYPGYENIPTACRKQMFTELFNSWLNARPNNGEYTSSGHSDFKYSKLSATAITFGDNLIEALTLASSRRSVPNVARAALPRHNPFNKEMLESHAPFKPVAIRYTHCAPPREQLPDNFSKWIAIPDTELFQSLDAGGARRSFTNQVRKAAELHKNEIAFSPSSSKSYQFHYVACTPKGYDYLCYEAETIRNRYNAKK